MESPPDRLAVVVSPTDVVQDSQLQLQTQNLELEKMNLKLQKQNVELQEHFNLVLKSKDPKRNEPSTGPFFHRYKSISHLWDCPPWLVAGLAGSPLPHGSASPRRAALPPASSDGMRSCSGHDHDAISATRVGRTSTASCPRRSGDGR